MATVFACGFECGSNLDKWTVAGTTVPTWQTSTVRTGARSMRTNTTAATGFAQHFLVTAAATHVGRFYVRWATLPQSASDIRIALWTVSAGQQVQITANQSGVVKFGFVTGTQVTHSTTVTTGVWYRFDFRILNNDGTGTKKMDVQVDGVTATQATLVEAGSNITAIRLGNPSSGITTDAFFDDVILGDATGDYPFGPGQVSPFYPTGDGTHSFTAGDFGDDAGTVLSSATTLWQKVDDAPMPIGGAALSAADWLEQIVLRTTGYLEFTFNLSSVTGPPRIVVPVIATQAETAATTTSEIRLNDNGTVESATTLGGGTVALTTIKHGYKFVATRPSGGGAWTVGSMSTLRVRWGYSNDANPDVRLEALLLEIDFTPVTTQDISPALLNQTAVPFAPVVTAPAPQTLTIGLLDQTAATFNPAAFALTTLASDAFGRTLSNDWGSADVGGAYSAAGGTAADYDVAGGFGTFASVANTNRQQSLAISALNVDFYLTVKVDKLPTADTLSAWQYVRRDAASNNWYRLCAAMEADGDLFIFVERRSAGGASTSIGPSPVQPAAKTTYGANDDFRMRFQVFNQTTGVATIRAKLWDPGSAEPAAWDIEFTDSTADNQIAGGVIVFTYTNNISNPPVLYSFDNLLVMGSGGTGSTQDISPGLINQAAVASAPTVTRGAVTYSPALINQAAATFAPVVSRQQFYTPALISQPAATFAPTVTRGAVTISLATISQSAVAFGPSLAGTGMQWGAWSATFTNTVSALTTVTLGLLSQPATTFAPTLTPGATSLTLALLNQTAAAQAPVTSTTYAVSVGRINQPAAAFSPALTTSTAVSAGFLSQAAVTFAPALSTTVGLAVGLIDRTAIASTPTISYAQAVSVGLISAPAASFGPVITVGAVNVSLGLINVTAVTFTPQIGIAQTVTFARISQTAVPSSPAITTGPVSVSLALINRTAVISAPVIGPPVLLPLLSQPAATFGPALTTSATVSVGLLSQVAAASAPSIGISIAVGLINRTAVGSPPSIGTDIAFGLINRTATASAPTILRGTVSVDFGRISVVASAFAPTISGLVSVSVGLLGQPATTSAPAITRHVHPAFIDSSPVVFNPNAVRVIGVGLINRSAATFTPVVINRQLIVPALLSASAVAFEPIMNTGQASIVLPRIDRTATAATPNTTTGAVNVSLARIDATAIVSAPSLSNLNTIGLGLLTRTATASAPTVNPGAVSVDFGRISAAAVAITPTITIGTAIVSPARIDQFATTLAASITTSAGISLGLISQPPTMFNPSVTKTGLVGGLTSTGVGSFAGLASIKVPGALPLAAAATFGPVGYVTRGGSLAANGIGTLGPRAAITTSGGLSGTATAAIAVEATIAQSGFVDLAGAGSLGAPGSMVRLGTLPATGTGTLAPTAAQKYVGALLTTASATFAATPSGEVIYRDSALAALGSASLGAAGLVSEYGATITSGVGTLVLAGTRTTPGALAVAGAGTLSAAGSLITSSAAAGATLSATTIGILGAGGLLRVGGALALVSSSTFAPSSGVSSGSAMALSGVATLGPAGQLALISSLVVGTAGTFGATGLTTAEGLTTLAAAASYDSFARLTLGGRLNAIGSATLGGASAVHLSARWTVSTFSFLEGIAGETRPRPGEVGASSRLGYGLGASSNGRSPVGAKSRMRDKVGASRG